MKDDSKAKASVLATKGKAALNTVAATMMFGAPGIIMAAADDDVGGNGTITGKIQSLFGGVYSQITSIASITAAILIVFALIIVGTSKDEKKGATALSWIKRILICWFAIVTIGPIISWISTIIGGPGTLTS